jgi:hypothetical protein
MDETMILLDDERQSETSLENWRKYLREALTNKATENGQFPHRAGSTGLAMELDAMNKIIDLAKQAVRIKKRSGKAAKKLAAEYLHKVADQLSQ